MHKIVVLLLFISANVVAQVKGKVADEAKNPVAYVNIWVEDENNGTTSDANGDFTILEKNKEKILVFSALGFETKKVRISEAEQVILKSAPIHLQEIVIAGKKQSKTITIGDYKKGGISHFFSSGKNPWIVARYFPFDVKMEQTPYIKELTIMTDSEVDQAKFLLHFYEVTANGNPGKDLTPENNLITVEKGQHNTTVKLEHQNLKIPGNGVFVAVEWLIIAENKYDFSPSLKDTASGSYTVSNFSGIRYEPRIGTVPSEESTSWRFTMGRWTKFDKPNVSNIGKYNNKFNELAIKLTLTN
ncbi:carboxypeptidase-like regulatory domain-containing protein [Flavobacterium cerinum]|uniref:Carboxypeptidase-like regulatory domain-containing protein n=1 Tax=Flavobacterium cerinum TaxID=2502784 RepID=A0ABY5ITX0_9FLAO|nr:carboxypeptidase-like regulatory domain-containing protein [Flavobacterium cerinum]UUC46288.1 carboxypeptidase-like regulatory domain-containing protein [Flavobacterium cerinum]